MNRRNHFPRARRNFFDAQALVDKFDQRQLFLRWAAHCSPQLPLPAYILLKIIASAPINLDTEICVHRAASRIERPLWRIDQHPEHGLDRANAIVLVCC
jgi:hypothetical protein